MRCRFEEGWKNRPSKILGQGFELNQSGASGLAVAVHRTVKTVVDVIVDQLPFRVGNRVFDGVELLSEVQARLSYLDHADKRAQMTFGALQALAG
jgi:hypothetical protein